MKQLDVGMGNAKRVWDGYEYFGTDIVKPTVIDEEHFRQADLVLDKVPFEDNSFELVTAYDFLEHLPETLYLAEYDAGKKQMNYRRETPLINIFNEIYRVLKDGGRFFFFVPVLPSEAVFQDPTHLNFWCQEKVNYFCGDYYGFHDHYGHISRFEKVSIKVEVHHMTVELKAIKNLSAESDYRLKYD